MNRTIRIGMLLMYVGFIAVGAVLADTVISSDTTYIGSLSGNIRVWFAVPVEVDGNLSVTLTPSDGVNMQLHLCTPEKNGIATNDCWGNPLTLSVNGVKPDTFYIGLWGYYGADVSHGFALTTVFSAAILENDIEPNDSTAYAKMLPLNGTVTGHIGYDGRWASNPADEFDWWQITTVEDGALTVTIAQVEPVNLHLAIFRPDGASVIVSADTWGDTTRLSIENLRDGTLFIRVAKYAWNFTPYTLWNEFTPAPGDNDPEPNDSTGGASELAIGVHFGGHLGYNGFRDNYGFDTVDWWHFTLEDTSALWITLTQVASANLRMQLYKDDGITLVHGGNDTWGVGCEMNIAEALPGKYYLKVDTYGVFDSYMLILSDSPLTGIGDIKVEQTLNVPARFELLQNYPNPFNPTTTILYQLPKSSFLKLSIYDIKGRLVEILVNERKNSGYYSVNWNAENVSSGIYFYQIDADDLSSVKKCLVVK